MQLVIAFRSQYLGLILAITTLPGCGDRLSACTLAVISGRITADQRPILWKNRDFASAPRNEVAILTDGTYRVIAVFNAGNRTAVWMGQNEAGLCIGNSLSVDLRKGQPNRGPGNGQFMKAVLQSCATVDEVIAYLEETNRTGRRTCGNFGIIDAQGGAAMFEIGSDTFHVFDANDPQVAPDGFIVRSNFATTAHELQPIPTPGECQQIASAGRYCRASQLLSSQESLSVDYVLQHMTRDLALMGDAVPGSVNADGGDLPHIIPVRNTISRHTTVSAAVFHGVQPGEDPDTTTMWVTLGDPKFSIAVPCWTNMDSVADPVAGERGGEIGETARTLRDASLTQESGYVCSQYLPGIWKDLWPREKEIIRTTIVKRNAWHREGYAASTATQWHQRAADMAYSSMQRELREAKTEVLRFSSGDQPQSKRQDNIRVAVYDHSPGTANGPKNLAKILQVENGFDMQRVSPEQIRSGSLSEFDLLIVPGGSGSKQSRMLEGQGREAIRNFVKGGGGYVGICAGSYLASSHYTWSLDLINANVWDRAHWARGTGTVQLELTPTGRSVLNSDSPTKSVYYGQGPLLIPGDHPGLPAYEVLADYETEIVSNGAVPGAMKDTHAIVRSTFGQGRVICISPHPERPDGPTEMITESVRWAARPKTELFPDQPN